MRKIFGTLVLFLVLSLHVFVEKTEASIFDIFKDPTEACMDFYVKDGGSLMIAAEECRGITKSEYNCVKKLVATGRSKFIALDYCREKKSTNNLFN